MIKTIKEQYCASSGGKNNSWCTDPCCNEDLQQSQCCRVRSKTYKIYSPKLIPDKLGKNCPSGGDKTPSAIEAAIEYAKLSTSPDQCFAKKSVFDAEMKQLEKIPDCCYEAVVGVYDTRSGKYKSKQKCSTHDDCFSGSCNIPKKTKKCQAASQDFFHAS